MTAHYYSTGATGPAPTQRAPSEKPTRSGEATSSASDLLFLQVDGTYIEETAALQKFRQSLPADIGGTILKADGARAALTILDNGSCWKAPVKEAVYEWEDGYVNVAEYFAAIGRIGVARAILCRLYEQLLGWQIRHSARLHKGKSLVKLSEAYRRAGWVSMAERCLFLTLVEDAISNNGDASESGGVCWRLGAINGWAYEETERWFKAAYSKENVYNQWKWCPEAVLQELGNEWMTALVLSEESTCWQPNKLFCNLLLQGLGSGGRDGGHTLERLASYLLSCIPGVRARRRVLTLNTDLDVFCTLEGELNDFRQDLGRHWICECKDTAKVGFSHVAKFARVLDASKCSVGILFAPNSVSGDGIGRYARDEISRLYQQRGIAIIVVDSDCLTRASEGISFLSIIRDKYETVRHNLWVRSRGPASKEKSS